MGLVENSISPAVIDAVAIILDARPLSFTNFTFTYICDGNSSNYSQPMLFSPSFIEINPVLKVNKYSLTFLGSLALSCSFSLNIHGNTSEEYAIEYPNGNTFQVIDSKTTLALPKLWSAIFSSSGEYVLIEFDAPTNRGDLPNSFLCSSLFEFSNSKLSKCFWYDDISVRLFSSEINIGDEISLKPNIIKSACLSSKCPINAPFIETSITVTSPINQMMSPQVAIASPHYLSPGSDLIIDLSSSIGHGGRPWFNFSVTAESPLDDTSELKKYLNLNFKISPPTPIKSIHLKPGKFYNFIVILCNFLGSCGKSVHFVTVLKEVVPEISILGPQYREIIRRDFVTINSMINSFSNGSLDYNWRFDLTGELSVNILSKSRDPTKFIISPFSLSFDSLYKVTLQVTDLKTKLASEVYIFIKVKLGELKAIISGGIEQTLTIGSTSSLDGSLSYDEDRSSELPSNDFTWELISTFPLFRPNCPVDYSVSDKSLLITPSLQTDPTLVCKAILSVSDGQRLDSTYVNVYFSLSKLDIDIYNIKSIISPSERLKLFSRIKTTSNQMASWHVDDSSVNLNQISLTPTRLSLRPLSLNELNLVLPSHILKDRSTYRFTLSCTTEYRVPKFKTISIVVNGPPILGTFAVQPLLGQELQTTFTFLSSGWYEEDLPISYSFGYISSTGNRILIQGESEMSYGYSQLPAGQSSVKFIDRLQCYSIVKDSYDSSTLVYFPVQVDKSSLSPNDLLSLIRSNMNNLNKDFDGYKKSISSSVSVLNSLSCDTCNTSKTPVRESIINMISHLTLNEEPSPATVLSWITSISEATQLPRELSADAISTALEILDSIFLFSESITQETSLPILSTINSIMETKTNIHSSNRRRRRLVSNLFTYDRIPSFYADYGKIRTTLLSFSRIFLNDMVQGQSDQHIEMSQFNCVFSSTISPGQSDMTFKPNAIGSFNSSITIPINTNSTNSNMKTTVFFVKNDFFGLNDIMSDPITLNIDSYFPGINDTVVTAYLSINRVYNKFDSNHLVRGETVRTRCISGMVYNKTHNCENGYNLTIQCVGSAGVFVDYCPSVYEVVKCAAVSSQNLGHYNSCPEIASDESSLTCSCKVRSEHSKLSIDIISYRSTAYYTFDAEWIPSPIQPQHFLLFNSKTSVAAGFVLIFAVFFLIFNIQFNKRAMDKKSKSISSIPIHIDNTYDRSHFTLFKKYHKYLSMFIPTLVNRENIYDPSNYTNIMFMVLFLTFGLFVSVLSYQTILTDNPLCGNFYEKADCLSYRSTTSFEDKSCEWNALHLMCEPIKYTNGVSFVTVFYVIVCTSFMAHIFYIFVDYFFNQSFLSFSNQPNPINSNKVSPFTSNPAISPFRNFEKDKKIRLADIFSIVTPKSSKVVMTFQDEFPIENNLENEFSNMISMICNYRDTLDDFDRKQFDDNWNFHDLQYPDDQLVQFMLSDSLNSKLCARGNHSTLTKLYEKLIRSRESYSREFYYCNQITKFARGFRLMHLFQMDLLPLNSYKILDGYERRINYRLNKGLSFVVKSLVATVLFLFYGFMIYTIVLFGSVQSDIIQISLCQTFLLWILYEVMFVESIYVYFLHTFIPSSVAQDLRSSRDCIIKAIQKVDINRLSESQAYATSEFNLSKYLVLPYRISEAFNDHLLENYIINTHTFDKSGE